ncbi:hypothetical protein [Flavobacterium pedocola]
MKHLFLLLMLFPTFLLAQEKAKFPDKLEGTFQIEFLSTATQPIAVTTEILEKIEAIRKEEQTTYFMVNDKVRIKVWSRKALQTIDKTRQPEYVVVEKFTN